MTVLAQTRVESHDALSERTVRENASHKGVQEFVDIVLCGLHIVWSCLSVYRCTDRGQSMKSTHEHVVDCTFAVLLQLVRCFSKSEV